jgi:hypothetical protein
VAIVGADSSLGEAPRLGGRVHKWVVGNLRLRLVGGTFQSLRYGNEKERE